MDWIWSWLLSAVGLAGFFLAGKKVWWAWYVNIANQVLWTFYSFITEQWGFLAGTAFYLIVFSRNAYLWTKEHRMLKKNPVRFEETRLDEVPEKGHIRIIQKKQPPLKGEYEGEK